MKFGSSSLFFTTVHAVGRRNRPETWLPWKLPDWCEEGYMFALRESYKAYDLDS